MSGLCTNTNTNERGSGNGMLVRVWVFYPAVLWIQICHCDIFPQRPSLTLLNAPTGKDLQNCLSRIFDELQRMHNFNNWRQQIWTNTQKRCEICHIHFQRNNLLDLYRSSWTSSPRQKLAVSLISNYFGPLKGGWPVRVSGWELVMLSTQLFACRGPHLRRPSNTVLYSTAKPKAGNSWIVPGWL